jgi:hypothetical protein
MGTGEKGRGTETKVPPAISAAKRAVTVIDTITFLFDAVSVTAVSFTVEYQKLAKG